VRWARLFADLDAQVEAGERADRAAESAELRRLEFSRVALSERLTAAVGAVLTLVVDGVEPLSGELTQVGADWVLVESGASVETLVALAAVLSATGLPATSGAGDELDQRLGLGVVLRRLARDRLAVTVHTRGGVAFTGTIDRVGADFLDLAEHGADQARRAQHVQRVRAVPFTAIALVRPA
jgi:hypothetical protein